jgi:type III pantothenate kinase
LILNRDTQIPLKNAYKTPETLGKDRIAAAVAAWHEFPGKDLLVIDAGTAITMDMVTKPGEFLGGAIAPGIDLRFKALHTFTGRLPLIKRKNINYLTGTSTEESINSGVINGIAAEIDGIIDKYKILYPDLITIFGGGDSKFLHKRLKNSIFALPNPVVNGLHTILNYNIENNKLT